MDVIPLGMRAVADLLGVTSKQVYMWHQRRATNGFPEPVAVRLRPAYPGDKKGAPLWDIEDVVDWYSTYHPNQNRGQHWAAKRERA